MKRVDGGFPLEGQYLSGNDSFSHLLSQQTQEMVSDTLWRRITTKLIERTKMK